MAENIKNRNYVLEKVYNIGMLPSASHALNHDITELTMYSARLGCVTNGTVFKLYVYCRMDESKVYNLATELGFIEF